MRSILGRSLTTCAALLVLAAAPATAQVRIVTAPGAPGFATIGEAVAAAVDGDMLIVGLGNYPGFTIDGKALSVFAVADVGVTIGGTIEVKNLSAQQTVVVRDLDAAGVSRYPVSDPALRITACAGTVRIESSSLSGGGGFPPTSSMPFGTGGAGVSISNSAGVAFSSVLISGGKGASASVGAWGSGQGGSAVDAINAHFSCFNSTLFGGKGGDGPTTGGTGNHGIDAQSTSFFFSGGSVWGGRGGDAVAPGGFTYGGQGGNGIELNGGLGTLLGASIYPGYGGTCITFPPDCNGDDGVAINPPGGCTTLPGAARALKSATGIASDESVVPLTLNGIPGDALFVITSQQPAYIVGVNWGGVWLLPLPMATSVSRHGTVPTSGLLQFSLRTPNVTRSMPVYMQGLVIPMSGPAVSTSPVHLALLDRASGPDCDGDGINDVLAAATGLVSDCDFDLIPDACGTDCNFNGIADECDIASGSSDDLNQNGIPDECEANSTWHVDAAAAPGGSGSAGAPFQNVKQAITASISGDAVLVRDGLYSGADNRSLNLGGRELLIASVNGPQNCIIDCQQLGPAYLLRSGEGAATRIQGFTILNGRGQPGVAGLGGGVSIENASATISDCIFRSCASSWGPGAILAKGPGAHSVVIERCQFEQCRGLSNGAVDGRGGAIGLESGARATIRDCLFTENTAGLGGAVWASADVRALISHCAFLRNNAPGAGGAILNATLAGASAPEMQIDNCLFAGNFALRGGAIVNRMSSGPTRLALSNSTFTANSAYVGGGVLLETGATTSIRNCVMWSNVGPSGAQLALDATSPIPLTSALIEWSDLAGGAAAVYVVNSTLNWGVGNLDADPLFADIDGPDNDPATFMDNDYRLAFGSPCIDAGNNTLVPPDLTDIDGDGDVLEPVPWDLDFLSRFVDIPAAPDTGFGTPPLVDLGAYERQP